MTQEKANKVYDILVSKGGAPEMMRDSFVHYHIGTDDVCLEWRFVGKLGYGGKYRSERNAVDCYLEDETPERLLLIDEINKKLKEIENE